MAKSQHVKCSACAPQHCTGGRASLLLWARPTAARSGYTWTTWCAYNECHQAWRSACVTLHARAVTTA